MDDRIRVYEEKMQKTKEHLKNDLAQIRAGRANPHVLDKITVDYYGTPTPLQGVGNITIPEARVIQIAPWDKNMLKAVEKAILASDVGVTPTNDGKMIRLVFPELTEERRKELSKEVKKKGEEAKVAVRNIRRDGVDYIKKLKGSEVSEDEVADLEDELQKTTDGYISEIDKIVDEKTKDVMTV
jgi:ribosome recycling factor